MKRILLLRHAKAVAKAAAEDFDRVLAPEGRADMELLAEALAGPELRPDVALVSPAARTRETWSLAGLDGVPARDVAAIYDAELETLIAVLRDAPDEAASVILVGHNPGIEEIAMALLAGHDPALARGMPTAALAVVDVSAATWRELALGTGTLARYVTPATLRGA